jgi:hypothetical protein
LGAYKFTTENMPKRTLVNKEHARINREEGEWKGEKERVWESRREGLMGNGPLSKFRYATANAICLSDFVCIILPLSVTIWS